MPKINIDGGNYVKEGEVKHKDVVTFANGGGWEDSNRFKKDDGSPASVFKINIMLANEEVRTITLNWTNIKLLVTAFGETTEDWEGKKVRAWKTKSEKAKSGFIFMYVPTDWDRDDTGEWVKGEKPEDDGLDSFEGVDEIPEGDIPFDNAKNKNRKTK